MGSQDMDELFNILAVPSLMSVIPITACWGDNPEGREFRWISPLVARNLSCCVNSSGSETLTEIKNEQSMQLASSPPPPSVH